MGITNIFFQLRHTDIYDHYSFQSLSSNMFCVLGIIMNRKPTNQDILDLKSKDFHDKKMEDVEVEWVEKNPSNSSLPDDSDSL